MKKVNEQIGAMMLQQNGDFYFSRPMIFFGSFEPIDEEECQDELEESMLPFVLDIDSKHPLQQNATGLYLHWFSS